MAKKKHNIDHLLQKNHKQSELIKKKERLMWFGVLCIVGLILVMWVWNMSILVYQTVQSDNTSPLLTEISTDFDKILEDNITNIK